MSKPKKRKHMSKPKKRKRISNPKTHTKNENIVHFVKKLMSTNAQIPPMQSGKSLSQLFAESPESITYERACWLGNGNAPETVLSINFFKGLLTQNADEVQAAARERKNVTTTSTVTPSTTY